MDRHSGHPSSGIPRAIIHRALPFIALPIGNSLDINSIHNQAKQIGTNSDGFLRNQGVGSWDNQSRRVPNGLNPNFWDYRFTTPIRRLLVQQRSRFRGCSRQFGNTAMARQLQ